ncbi:hypothetical protein KIPB_005565, partial [Kipferlia bialata]|eukprot:g5565.t1
MPLPAKVQQLLQSNDFAQTYAEAVQVLKGQHDTESRRELVLVVNMCLSEMREFEKCVDQMQKHLESDPEFAEGFCSLGNALRETGKA